MNAMGRAVALAEGHELGADDIRPPEGDETPTRHPRRPPPPVSESSLPTVVRRSFHGLDQPEIVAMIRAALAASGGNRAEAARRLGVDRSTLWRRMKRYGIE
jgi:two-component system NtrC family response regulator